MDMQEFMKVHKARVEEELRRFFAEKKESVEHPLFRDAVEVIEEYTLRGGKRIRAILMILGYRLYGGEGDEIMKAAAALELVQSYFLIHDDIMDESDLRRGKATIHRIYEARARGKVRNPGRFGENSAIIAGDLANIYAIQLFQSSDFPHERKSKALEELLRIMEYTGYGQLIDVYSAIMDEFTERDLLTLHEYKTANYTIYGPLALGAILAGGDPEVFKDFAIPIGIAFQLQDDILGLFGTEEKIGKPVTSDLAEGKKTLLIIKALENASGEEKEVINKALGNPEVTLEELEKVREIVRRTGSLDYSRSLAEKLVNDGKRHLEGIKFPRDEYRKILMDLADYMIRRTK